MAWNQPSEPKFAAETRMKAAANWALRSAGALAKPKCMQPTKRLEQRTKPRRMTQLLGGVEVSDLAPVASLAPHGRVGHIRGFAVQPNTVRSRDVV